MSALRELLAKFGIEVDHKELEKGHEAVEGFKETLKEFGAGLAEALGVYEIKEFVEAQVEAGARLADLSEQLGITTDELQKFQFAAKLGGVDSETAAHSLGLFTKQLGKAAEGGGEAGKALKAIGVSFKNADGSMRPTLDILEDVADHMQATEDPTKRAALATQLFGRAGLGMIPVLKDGGEGVRKLYEEFDELGGGMSSDFVKSAKEVDDELAKVQLGMRALKTQIVAALLPGIKRLVGFFKDAAKTAQEFTKHTHILSTGLTFLGVVAGVKAIGTLKNLATTLGLLKPSVLETIAALAGFVLPLALLALLYLAFDELWTLLQGGDTVIGDALGPDKAQFIQDIRTAVEDLQSVWEAFKEVASAVAEAVWGVDKALEPLGTVTSVKDLARDMRELAEQVKGALENILHLVAATKSLVHGDLGGTLDALKETTVGKMITGGPSNPVLAAAGKALGVPDSVLPHYTPPNLLPGGQPPSYMFKTTPNFVESGAGAAPVINQTINNKVDVHTSSDQPRAVGDAVGIGLASPIQRANDKAYTNAKRP